jgi:hypothetical protein
MLVVMLYDGEFRHVINRRFVRYMPNVIGCVYKHDFGIIESIVITTMVSLLFGSKYMNVRLIMITYIRLLQTSLVNANQVRDAVIMTITNPSHSKMSIWINRC